MWLSEANKSRATSLSWRWPDFKDGVLERKEKIRGDRCRLFMTNLNINAITANHMLFVFAFMATLLFAAFALAFALRSSV